MGDNDALYHQDWDYPSKGVYLNMASETIDGLSTVHMIKLTYPSQLRTSRGISVGDSYDEVLKKYQQDQNIEQSVPFKTFVAGSIYGGLVFSFQQNRVVRIALGYLAE